MSQIQGWLTDEIAADMRQLIFDRRPRVVVEIGVFYGRSLINAAEALKKNGYGMIYGIDPWRRSVALSVMTENDNADYWKQLNYEDVHNECMGEIWKRGLDNVVIIRCRSDQCAQLFRSINILYIDGGHTEEVSCKDVELYLPKVSKGGYIWIDDTDWASLQKAVTLLAGRCKLIKDYGNAHLYRKQ